MNPAESVGVGAYPIFAFERLAVRVMSGQAAEALIEVVREYAVVERVAGYQFGGGVTAEHAGDVADPVNPVRRQVPGKHHIPGARQRRFDQFKMFDHGPIAPKGSRTVSIAPE